MKNLSLLCLLAFLVAATGCTHLKDPLEDIDPPNIKDTLAVEPDLGLDDPHIANLVESCTTPESAEMEDITIADVLPEIIDLSSDMPPVKSQGNIGSCASFATAYYMKSYQEKIQYGYEYNITNVMSPAYLYNQVKVSEDCMSGSCFEANLSKLKNEGTDSWKTFPYDSKSCSKQPTSQQKELAAPNKIASFYRLDGSDADLIAKIKTLISQKTPVLYGAKLDKAFADGNKNEDSLFVWRNYDSAQHYGNHGMVIVGYNDKINAFKIVNSWGTSWANKGYGYIDYSFFMKDNENETATLLGLFYSKDLN